MRCVKVFDPNSKKFMYRWDAVNTFGQSIDTHSFLHKKTADYRPMPCTDSKRAVKDNKKE